MKGRENPYLEELVEKMQIVEFNNESCIGLVEDGKITNAYVTQSTNIRNRDLREWLKRANLENLRTIIIKGNKGFTVYDLQPEQRVYIETCLTVMKHAIMYMRQWMENEVFDRLLEQMNRTDE